MWLLYASPLQPVQLGSVHDSPRPVEGVLGLWLGTEPESASAGIVDIRRHSPYAHLPVFAGCELPVKTSFLCDGYAVSLEAALDMAGSWRPSVSNLRGGEIIAGSALALTKYLYLRPTAALSPVRDRDCRSAYRFPLLEAFVDGETPDTLLSIMRRRGWVEQTQLVDRLRRCNDCNSVHLNYVDVCPACKSLNIAEAVFIHCFTCSHLAPQEEFRQRENLVCPNCNEPLKHIGVDYSRPLEHMHCFDCALTFADARVVARCLDCGCENEPESLPVINIASYALSEDGRVAAVSGDKDVSSLLSLRMRSLTTEACVEMVGWLLGIAQRKEGAGFALVGLKLIVSSFSEGNSAAPGDEIALHRFVDRLQNSMRSTDLLAWFGSNLLIIILPCAKRSDGEAALERICRRTAEARDKGTGPINAWGMVRATAEIPEGASAKQILDELLGELEGG